MNEQPIRDVRTCREKQDEAIEALGQITYRLARNCDDIWAILEPLRARVSALEAEHNAMIPTLSEEVGRLRQRVAALEAAQNITITIAGTRDPETGDIQWSEPHVTGPILGSVTWDTGAIRWTRGATPAGWRKEWWPAQETTA